MKPMTHYTLTPRYNAFLIGLWSILLIILVLVVKPVPILSVLVGVGGGFAIGFLQMQAIQTDPSRFARAQSALEVREAIRSSKTGQPAIVLQYVIGALIFICGLISGITGYPLLLYWLAGYIALMLMREILTFRATFLIQQADVEK